MPKITLNKALPWILIVAGVVGILASAIIMIEKLHVAQDPSYQPSCNINPIISCGSVMKSEQSHIFGFTNPLIGLAAFPVLVVTGVVMLQGLKLKRWYWLGLQIGTVFGIGFVHWLYYQTTYNINALCPYCISVWIATITTFWYVLLYNLQEGHIKLPKRWAGFGKWLRTYHLDILLFWFLLLIFFDVKHFWYYIGANL